MKQVWTLLVTLIFCNVALYNVAWGHASGVTDTNIKLGASTVRVTYTVPNDHLELLPNHPNLTQTIAQGFRVENDKNYCNLSSIDLRPLDSIGSTQYIIFYGCEGKLTELTISYSLFFDSNPEHQNISRIAIAGRHQSFIFTATNDVYSASVTTLLKLWDKRLSDKDMGNNSGRNNILSNNSTQPKNQFSSLLENLTYFNLGFEHILLGFDHIIFLIGLLLLPVKFKQLVLIITMFTLAHSITLALSVLNIVSAPAFFVEAAIAFSIVFVAIENLWETRNQKNKIALASAFKRRLVVTFIFGLIHGFGFSYILKEIGFGDQLTLTLFLFNGGVEVGQLLIVLLVYPALLFAFRNNNGVVLSRASSAVIGLVGCGWLIGRMM